MIIRLKKWGCCCGSKWHIFDLVDEFGKVIQSSGRQLFLRNVLLVKLLTYCSVLLYDGWASQFQDYAYWYALVQLLCTKSKKTWVICKGRIIVKSAYMYKWDSEIASIWRVNRNWRNLSIRSWVLDIVQRVCCDLAVIWSIRDMIFMLRDCTVLY